MQACINMNRYWKRKETIESIQKLVDIKRTFCFNFIYYNFYFILAEWFSFQPSSTISNRINFWHWTQRIGKKIIYQCSILRDWISDSSVTQRYDRHQEFSHTVRFCEWTKIQGLATVVTSATRFFERQARFILSPFSAVTSKTTTRVSLVTNNALAIPCEVREF